MSHKYFIYLVISLVLLNFSCTKKKLSDIKTINFQVGGANTEKEISGYPIDSSWGFLHLNLVLSPCMEQV